MPWIIVALGGVGTLIPLFSPTVRAGTDRPSAQALSGCPLEGDFGLPAYFAYEPEGRTRSAEAAIVLPAGFKEVRRLLDDVRGYPDWVLLTTRIVGYHARFSVEGIEQPMRDYLLRKPGNVGYEFRVAEDGFTLSYGVF